MSKAHHSSLRSRLGAPQGWRRVAASAVHKDAMSRLQELKRFVKKYKLEVDKAAENDRKAQDAMAQPRKREKERARAVQETQLYVDQVPKECLDRDGILSQSSLLKGIQKEASVASFFHIPWEFMPGKYIGQGQDCLKWSPVGTEKKAAQEAAVSQFWQRVARSRAMSLLHDEHDKAVI